MTIDFSRTIATDLDVGAGQVTRSIELFDADNTVPFVARYRKEVTGGLDEAQLRTILERLTYLRNLEARRETVLKTIEEQDKLTGELRARIEGATTLQEVEDLYLPYKPKRRTRATIARERGLEGDERDERHLQVAPWEAVGRASHRRDLLDAHLQGDRGLRASVRHRGLCLSLQEEDAGGRHADTRRDLHLRPRGVLLPADRKSVV